MGWTAVGTIADAEEDRDYTYGVSPQALLALRFLFGDAVMLDMSLRDYYVDGGGSSEEGGNENVLRGQGSLTVRVHGRHAIGLHFVATTRDDDPFDVSGTIQTVGALSLVYTWLGDEDLGAVAWR